ncbi:MAG: chromate transporter [Clostridiales bacterium]|nr:chromate transporter [Clostridiales bacterium]
MEWLTMCAEFLKTGLFAVGGGLATLPFLTQIQEKYGWFTAEELANMIAVGESTPGPIGVNMATYVGFSSYGVLGGLLATFSLVLPSLIVIMVIARAMDKYQKNPMVQNMFAFMRPAVAGLIAAAGYSVLKIALFHPADTFWASVSWIAVAFYAVLVALLHLKPLKKLHPVVLIAAGAVIGVLLKM